MADTELQQLQKTQASGGLNPVQQTRFDELSKGSSTSDPYDSLIASTPKASDAAATINSGIDKTFGEYLDKVNSAPTSLDTYQKNINDAGIPQLQKTQSSLQGQIYSLEDAIKNVEPQVAGTTQNSLVTNAQRQGIIQEKTRPLNDSLATTSTALGRVSSAVQQGKSDALTLTGLSQQDSQRVLDAYKQKLDLAVTQGAQSLQAFIHDSDTVLNVTLEKIHRGEQVSDQEAQNAFQLLQMQEQAKAAAAKAPDTQIVDQGGKKVLINSQTGQVISTYTDTPKVGTTTPGVNLNTYVPQSTASVPTTPKPTVVPNFSQSGSGGASSALPSWFIPAK